MEPAANPIVHSRNLVDRDVSVRKTWAPMKGSLRRMLSTVLAAMLLNSSIAVAIGGVTMDACQEESEGGAAHLSMASQDAHHGMMAVSPEDAASASCCDLDAGCETNGHCASLLAIAVSSDSEHPASDRSFSQAAAKDYQGLHAPPPIRPPILR